VNFHLNGCTPLCQAAGLGALAMVSLIIESRAAVNMADEEGAYRSYGLHAKVAFQGCCIYCNMVLALTWLTKMGWFRCIILYTKATFQCGCTF
jgi:hypothetical protein